MSGLSDEQVTQKQIDDALVVLRRAMESLMPLATERDFARFIEQIRVHEGYSRHPYRDTEGNWTVGIGHNIEEEWIVGPAGSVLDRLSDRNQHELWLALDLLSACRGASMYLGVDVFKRHATHTQLVLIELAFWMGYSRLKGFVRMREALLQHNLRLAEHELKDSKLYRQYGVRAGKLALQLRLGPDAVRVV